METQVKMKAKHQKKNQHQKKKNFNKSFKSWKLFIIYFPFGFIT